MQTLQHLLPIHTKESELHRFVFDLEERAELAITALGELMGLTVGTVDRDTYVRFNMKADIIDRAKVALTAAADRRFEAGLSATNFH